MTKTTIVVGIEKFILDKLDKNGLIGLLEKVDVRCFVEKGGLKCLFENMPSERKKYQIS